MKATRTQTVTQTQSMNPWLPRPVPIVRVQRETRDTFTITLDVSDSAQGLAFLPGQFTMLYLFGVGDVPISISGDAAKPMSLVHTIRAVGGVTRPLQKLKRGAVLGVRGPFGTSWPIADARGRDILIIAGGIGLAPLRPLIYHVLRRRQDYGHVHLVYGTRSPADILFRQELERWGGRFDMDVSVTVDHGTLDWYGDVGVVTTLLEKTRCEPNNSVAFACGPEIMMRFTVRGLNKLGMSDEQIYVSMERNMQCAVGLCGHCQYGPLFICKDGPVFRFDKIKSLFGIREI
jgi:NAD(P)H-flavin reductase